MAQLLGYLTLGSAYRSHRDSLYRKDIQELEPPVLDSVLAGTRGKRVSPRGWGRELPWCGLTGHSGSIHSIRSPKHAQNNSRMTAHFTEENTEAYQKEEGHTLFTGPEGHTWTGVWPLLGHSLQDRW